MTDYAPPALDHARVRETVERLSLRVGDRFPESGLASVATALLTVADDTERVLAWIERPNVPLRVGIGAVVVLLLGVLFAGLNAIDLSSEDFAASELVPLVEAATNELILIGAAILFLVGIETRNKRRRVIHAVNRLRGIAHVIDAHQLTKDPTAILEGVARTKHSPERGLTPEELNRYLDYCTEMLAMVAKLGFLYVQRFDDAPANQAVNELESLTTGLSRKIWQKMMILESRRT
ncbi:MAG: hypothetical protein AAFZ65_13590 [Planctomycetota bacterium]